MASSGSFNTGSYQGRYLQFAWSIPDGGQSIAANTTKINWSLTGRGTGQSGYYTSGNFKVTIDGTVVYQSATRINLYDGTVVASGTVTLAHGADGTKTFSASAEAGIYTVAVNCSGSGSFELPAIARASAISSAGNVTLGDKCSVVWTPRHKDFGYKLKFSMGSWSYTTGAIVPGTTAAYTYAGYTLPLEAASQIPNSKTGTMTVALYSFTDSTCTTQIGTASTASFTVTVPISAAPNISMVLSPVNSLASPFNTLYIQGKTIVQADFSASAGQYGASIASRAFNAGIVTDTTSPFQSSLLGTSGIVAVKGTVTDSRGYFTTQTKEINVIQYSSPAVVPYSGEKSIICARCLANGTLDPAGTYLRIKAGRQFSKVMSGGAQKNFCLLGYRYALSGASLPATFTTLLAKTATADEIDIVLSGVTLAATSSYVVQIYVKDDVGDSSTLTFGISTDQVAFHLKDGGKGAAFGKYAEEDGVLDIAWDARVRGNLYIGEGEESISDFVTEAGEATVGTATWRYRKWHSGRFDLWSRQEIASGTFSGSNNVYYSSVISLTLPFTINSSASQGFVSLHSSGITWAVTVAAWSTTLNFSVGRLYGGTDSLALTAQIYITGMLET